MGVGGGIVLVPLLVHALHMAQHEAQGTSLAFVIVTALVAVVPYYGHEKLDLALALWLTLGALPGVLLGSRLADRTSAARLRIAFGAVILVTAIRLLAAPPQALMYLPAVSNTITGGAAIDACSGLSVRGRCKTQTLSCASMATLEGSPSFHCGGTFGHARSTSKIGRLRPGV